MDTTTSTHTDDAATAEEMALEAERRAMEAPTQETRETWQRIAADWWSKT